MKQSRIALAGAVAGLTAVSAAQANLLINGGFESPVVPVGGYTNEAVGTHAITGWNVVGANGNNVTVFSGSDAGNGYTYPSQDGVQWINLSRGVNDPTLGVSQTIATTAGELYQISFYIGNYSNGNGYLGNTSTVKLSINGTPAFSDTNSTATTTVLAWQQFTHTFVAAGTSTTLAFLDGDAGKIDSLDSHTDNIDGLDAVVLTDTGTFVPEPASFLLLGTGLLGLAARARRRATRI